MRWPRFLRRRARRSLWVDAAPLTFHSEQRTVMTRDGPMTVRVPVLDDPALLNLDATADSSQPYGGGLTWEQFSASMQAIEGDYRGALRSGFRSPPVPEWPPWAREQLDKLDQDDAADGKLEP